MMNIILGMAAVTYLTRALAFAVFNKTGISPAVARWLKHVPTGMLTALIAPALLLPHGTMEVSLENHYLLAGAIAVLAAYRFNNVLWTMGLGLLAMILLRVCFS
ncbi:branched-chain amino acid transport azld [Lucifera butyrica]|uniref:Branched-chain amino acid transport azld n=1 Tax=Lucifera butyrica TaxID=1351585 RepID=A0A498RCK0_9FIRM|nr:AzlD domain-containing protein [Lucifera butyrica]VBB07813.1 branched-chain amino acid transport azld [Lucifera butyrica]